MKDIINSQSLGQEFTDLPARWCQGPMVSLSLRRSRKTNPGVGCHSSVEATVARGVRVCQESLHIHPVQCVGFPKSSGFLPQ
ncbi:uncharacterized protein LOC132389674 isoform X2 [Hypanus sabinus]|uniref:uncharacterized protein LOC132389674 isoform X2 n=1 Tax=Hypanus sabinus TaxID=79690 RepID=UPI0028C3BB4A|nr:uncharacterized protein LOC132389674 isoform X2 [Hypanus sabinus]